MAESTLHDLRTIFDSGVFSGRQSWELDRAVRTRGGNVLRVRLDRDAIDFQSSFTVQLWTDRGWTEVVRMHGTEPQAVELPRYGRITEEVIRAAEGLAGMLLLRAMAVVEP